MARGPRRFHQAGEQEVAQQGFAIGLKKDILRFEVRVNDPLRMRKLQRFSDLAQECHYLFQRQQFARYRGQTLA